jgi:hypothetical protein
MLAMFVKNVCHNFFEKKLKKVPIKVANEKSRVESRLRRRVRIHKEGETRTRTHVCARARALTHTQTHTHT